MASPSPKGQNEGIRSLDLSMSDDLHREFWDRVQTYIAGQRWITRPLDLSPAVCARFGWKCLNSNLLECVTCAAKLSPGQPDIKNYASYKSCVSKVLEDLEHSHKKHCPWPLTPSPESFVKMRAMQKEEALHQFTKRLKSFLPPDPQLPAVKAMLAEELGLDAQRISALCKLVEVGDEDAERFGPSLVILAATGWSLDSHRCEGKHSLKCCDCQRSTGMSLFQCLGGGEKQAANGASEEPSPKKQRKSLSSRYPFDPLYEHRPWCLWLCPGLVSTEADGATPAGWELFVMCLLKNLAIPDAPDNSVTSPSQERLRNIREMLETWKDN